MTASLTEIALSRIRADVRAMHAYTVQAADGLLKMDAMENPFGLPPALQSALGQRLGALALNRYPGSRTEVLRDALARHAGMPEGCALILGNGSDELISLVALACARPGAQVLAPLPGFVMYGMSAQLQGLGFTGVALNPAMVARVMKAAEPGALVNTLHTSVITAGLAFGSWAGGEAIDAGFGLRAPLWVGAALAGLGLISLARPLLNARTPAPRPYA